MMPPRLPVLPLLLLVLPLDMLRTHLGSSMVAQPDSIRRLLHPHRFVLELLLLLPTP